jgi:hypothetical protein
LPDHALSQQDLFEYAKKTSELRKSFIAKALSDFNSEKDNRSNEE